MQLCLFYFSASDIFGFFVLLLVCLFCFLFFVFVFDLFFLLLIFQHKKRGAGPRVLGARVSSVRFSRGTRSFMGDDVGTILGVGGEEQPSEERPASEDESALLGAETVSNLLSLRDCCSRAEELIHVALWPLIQLARRTFSTLRSSSAWSHSPRNPATHRIVSENMKLFMHCAPSTTRLLLFVFPH